MGSKLCWAGKSPSKAVVGNTRPQSRCCLVDARLQGGRGLVVVAGVTHEKAALPSSMSLPLAPGPDLPHRLTAMHITRPHLFRK